jgi:two-component system, OmpR family, sensor histidine kinase BaeS
VVVAVALRRLYLYEEAYGWTRLRLWVHAFELWMGLVIVLVAVTGIRLTAAWLPRAIAASGAAGLLALGLLNPDGFIATRNVDHFQHTGNADLAYLSTLSADAAPALNRLPEPQRSCALRHLADALQDGDSWTAVNLSRSHARALLRHHPIERSLIC